ncbi:hypothetical protein SAMN05216344_10714 [Polaromonas sp. OV174]|nr:hypothetical protein SAMN05216344_10714 [Polaromonas sp. OV174]
MQACVSPAAVSLYDARPFFEKALQFGVQNGILDRQKLDAISTDAPKGMVQIARYFGNEFLRPDLEKAKDRIVNLVSLYLESSSGGDLRLAAESLRDHSFLSRSKGGSDMLKALLALPESNGFDAELEQSDPGAPVKGLAEWSLKSLADYQAELARRQPIKQEKDAAIWLAGQLGLELAELEDAHTHAEAVIRTALLVFSTKGSEWPDWVEFEKMLAGLRTKSRPAPNSVAGKTEKAAKTGRFSMVVPENLPDEFREVVLALQPSILADLALLLDSPLPARALFAMDGDEQAPPLLGRYFWLEDLASELDHHERSVSAAWDKVTGGNGDEGSLLTLLVCVAAGAAPKTVLSEKSAAALVRKIQKAGAKPGFDPALSSQYLRDWAPAHYQDDYLQLWADFVEESQSTLQSDSTFALQDALALLRRECHVKS